MGRIGGKKEGKHFRGQREGGVSENASYYVFVHAPGKAIEAIPIKEWYNFIPRVNYRTLDAEEAEEKFAQRGKILNLWALNINKKLKPGEDIDVDEDDNEKGKKGGKKKEKEFKISDMDDDLLGSGDELDSSSDEEKEKKKPDSDDEGGSKNKGKGAKKKKSAEDVANEGFEDSDDGEEEGREVDYMSDESSDDEEIEEAKYNIQGVDADEGLAKMLDSESDEEDAEDKDDKDDDESNEKNGKKEENGKKSGKNSANNSRSGSPAPDTKKEGDEKSAKAEKRKAMVDKLLDPNAESTAKKGRFEGPSTSQPVSGSLEASFEEDVRRYLARKPMTTTEILRKITSKKTGLSKEALMPLLVNVLKRINPHKQKVKGTMYLSLKTGK